MEYGGVYIYLLVTPIIRAGRECILSAIAYEHLSGVQIMDMGIEVVNDQPEAFRCIRCFQIQGKSSLVDLEAKRDTRTTCAEDSIYHLPAGVNGLGTQLYDLKII